MTRRVITISSGADRSPVPAVLRTGLEPSDLEAAELQWSGHRPIHAEHARWDWMRKKAKLRLPSRVGIAVECDERFQGIMLLASVGKTSLMPGAEGMPIVYVEFVESAPWNAPPERRYRGVGVRMIAEAIRMSAGLGYGGRVGLHSLRQSIGFYREKCRMTWFGPDLDYYNLGYLEFAPDQAALLPGVEETPP